MVRLIIVLLLFVFLCPSYEKLNNTHQDYLWTASNDRREEQLIKDIQFRLGGEVDDLKPWWRIRLGFPATTTIDYQADLSIMQVRIEPLNILYLTIGLLLLTTSLLGGYKALAYITQ